ncbi:MAG: CPBP family intramembrane metalloprotease [Muribaculaceae bacterium]|nr:CPBP family intramembrane metalloprotease [Muribaculaceae bacterium]
MARLVNTRPLEFLGVTTDIRFRQFIGASLALILLLPFINFLMEWNAGWVFPESLDSLESRLREWEDSAADTTSMILGSSSVGALISGILVIGVLTGLAEESFFRAGMQRALVSSGVNHHLSIILIAILFSAFHFQFYGFVPRFILGALFGYLYYYTHSLWVSAFAHALNNSLVVVTAWVAANGGDISIFESIDTTGAVWPLASLILFTLFVLFLWRPLLHKPSR